MLIDYSTWLPIAEAAEATGLCEATIRQLAKNKQIRAIPYKRPTGGMTIKVYNPADIQRIRQEKNPEALVKSQEPAANSSQAFLGILEALQNGSMKPSELRFKIYLNAEEAVAYTGLGIETLRKKAANGLVERQGRGGKLQSEVFKRVDLDRL